MARVFVSHAREDRECAGQLHQLLVAEGHEVFLDQDSHDGIAVGEQWSLRLHERLRWADAVVCLVTSAYLKSTWCTAEVAIAQSQGRRLLPVLAESDLAGNPRAELAEALRRVDAAGGFGWPDDRSPFPGLRPFDVDQHRVFFGRTDEVGQLAGLLRSPAEQAKRAALLVVGPSGCGKSSLVRAGLLHVMADEPGWRTLRPILPGADPVGALAWELAAVARRIKLDWTVEHVHHQLDKGGLATLAKELLLADPAGPQQRLLVVVDQFEELLTQAPPGQRARFAELLRPALGGPVQVVATLRPEFLDQLLVDADLAVLPTRTYTLRPLHREALRAVIQGPASLAGIEVGDELVARVVADTDSGEALPLLAFTLAQLADGVGRGGQLSSARYAQLGGVQGALTCLADAALADAIAASGRRGEEVITGLLRLVTVDEQGRPTRWRVPLDELPEPMTRELDAFVTRRLVTTDTDNGSVVIGVAHEAFLTAWTPLTQAITTAASPLRARRAVEQAATEWNDNGRPPDRLWERGQLAAAVADTGARIQAHDLVTDRVELSPTARTFLRVSIRHDRVRRRRATAAVLSMLLVLALAATVVAFIQQQQRNAMSRQAAAQAMELRTKNPALAAQLSLAAYRLAPTTTEARNSLLNTFATPYTTQLTGHTNDVYSVAFSPDRRTLATGSGDMTVRLWDVSNPHHFHLLSNFTAHTTFVRSVAFSSDGRTLAIGSFDDTVRLWNVSDPRKPSPLCDLTGHTKGVYSVAFSSDGRTLATGSYDKTVRLWDVSDPRYPSLLGTLTDHIDTVTSVAFSADGRTLATGSYDKTVRLWDVSDSRKPSLLGTLTGHTKDVNSVDFSPDGHTLATGSDDKTVRLWDVSDPHHFYQLRNLTGHADAVYSVAFSADGRTLATGSYDMTVRLWDVSDPHHSHSLGTLTGHTKGVSSVAFSPDGHTLATGSYDDTVRLWDLSDPRYPSLLKTLTGHTNAVYSVVFSLDRRTLATGSGDGTVRLWDVSNLHHSHLLGSFTGHTKGVSSVAFSPDGHTLATGSYDDTVRLWDLSDPRYPSLLKTLTGHTNAVYSVVFSLDRRTLATGSGDGTVRLWDVSNPRQPSLTLTGHTKDVLSVAFSPDGHTLATASLDGTARLWETNVDSVATRICSITPAITKSQWEQYLPGLLYRPLCP